MPSPHNKPHLPGTRPAKDIQDVSEDVHHIHDDPGGPLPEGRAVPQPSARGGRGAVYERAA